MTKYNDLSGNNLNGVVLGEIAPPSYTSYFSKVYIDNDLALEQVTNIIHVGNDAQELSLRANVLYLTSLGTIRWFVESDGHLKAYGDNIYDIGAVGVKPRIIYAATRVDAPTLRTDLDYTVATLPAAGVRGRRAHVTDANAPTFLGALVGGGAVRCPVFDNGTAWVAG